MDPNTHTVHKERLRVVFLPSDGTLVPEHPAPSHSDALDRGVSPAPDSQAGQEKLKAKLANAQNEIARLRGLLVAASSKTTSTSKSLSATRCEITSTNPVSYLKNQEST